MHTWRSGGSVQSDSILLLKPSKLSFPLLFSPGLIIIMLCLLSSPQVLLDKIQRVINCSARLIFKVPKSAHITPFLYNLHWQPDSIQNSYICIHIVSGTAPPYLSELLHLYSLSHSLRSATDTHIVRVPRMGKRALGERSFQYNGPVFWNSRPLSVRHSSSLS